MPRVYVIDPWPVEREGFAAILSSDEGFDVVGIVADLGHAARDLPEARADVVLLDAHVSGTTWTNVGARLHDLSPRSGVLLLARSGDDGAVAAARRAGFQGLVLKSSPIARIRHGVRAVAAGEAFFDDGPPVASGIIHEPNPFGLTRQQARVLELIPRGLTNREIGVELHLSEHTVKTHVTQILRKLRARDRAHAAVIALREGLV